MSVEPELRHLFISAIPFVLARKKENGGFGGTPRLPATIEDTYHALRILQLCLQYNAAGKNDFESCGDEYLRSYLASCRQNLPGGIRTIFQLLWCCRSVGLQADNIVPAAVSAGMRASDALEDWYYGTRILLELLGWDARTVIGLPHYATVMKGEWRTVKEAWKHISLSWEISRALPLPEAELTAWFQACQNGDGGFGFFPGTTSFVENCHASLRALEFLGAGPRDRKRALGFLTRCGTISGGFGRSSRTAPFLDATWHALAALAIIDISGAS